MKKINLSQGKSAIVDDEDYELLNQWKWHIGADGYAKRTVYIKGSGRKNQKSKKIFMHRVINNTPDGFETDHVNRNRLDDRRSNLRTVTRQENAKNLSIRNDNTSGVKGVIWHKQMKKWWARIRVDKKTISLGLYRDIKIAQLARKIGERTYI